MWGSEFTTKAATYRGEEKAPRSSTCGAQRAAPRATAWTPRPSTCAAPRASGWAPRSMYLRRTTRQRPGHHDQVCTTSCAAGSGLGITAKYLRRRTSCAAGRSLADNGDYFMPLHHKRPAFALFCACLFRHRAEQHSRGPVSRFPVCVYLGPGLARCVHK
jgi:hypothetical protein